MNLLLATYDFSKLLSSCSIFINISNCLTVVVMLTSGFLWLYVI